MTVSLLGSARMTAPLRGSEPPSTVRETDIALMAKDDLPPAKPTAVPLVGKPVLGKIVEPDREIAFAR